ncbi:GGDEF domain-containing protein [Halomonas alkalisoli]|nr:GGDEF domain-containing protein [Halomonas alkalisoli]MCE9680998.1 GGDEF domain-containing protein [Halomonas alkalisoli]
MVGTGGEEFSVTPDDIMRAADQAMYQASAIERYPP